MTGPDSQRDIQYPSEHSGSNRGDNSTQSTQSKMSVSSEETKETKVSSDDVTDIIPEEQGDALIKPKKARSPICLLLSTLIPISVVVILIIALCCIYLITKEGVLPEPTVVATQPINGSVVPFISGEDAILTPTFGVNETESYNEAECLIKSRHGKEDQEWSEKGWMKGVNNASRKMPDGTYIFEFKYQCKTKTSKTKRFFVRIDSMISNIAIKSGLKTNSPINIMFEDGAPGAITSIVLKSGANEFHPLGVSSVPEWLHKASVGVSSFSFVTLQPGEYSIKTTNSNGSSNIRSFEVVVGEVEVQDETLTPSDTTTIFTKSLFENKTGSKLKIGPNVETIIPGSLSDLNISSFILDELNGHFMLTSDGVLLTADGEEVVVAPPKLVGDVIIPNTVRLIREYAFANCTELTSISLYKDISDIRTNAFKGANKDIVLKVAGVGVDWDLKRNGTPMAKSDSCGPSHFLGDGGIMSIGTTLKMEDSPLGDCLEGRIETCVLEEDGLCLSDTKHFTECVEEGESFLTRLHFVDGDTKLQLFDLSPVIDIQFDCSAPVRAKETSIWLKGEELSLSFSDEKSSIKSVSFSLGGATATAEAVGTTTPNHPKGSINCVFEGKTVKCKTTFNEEGILKVTPTDNVANEKTYEIEISNWTCDPDSISEDGVITAPTEFPMLVRGMFDNCNSATSVVLNSGIERIDEGVFDSLVNLKSFTFNPGTNSGFFTVADGVLFEGSGTSKLLRYPCAKEDEPTLGSDTTHIGAHSFYGCSNIRKLTIHSHLTAIGLNAFGGAGIKSFEIPDTTLEYNVDGAEVVSPHSMTIYGKDFTGNVAPFSLEVTDLFMVLESVSKSRFLFSVNGQTQPVPNALLSFDRIDGEVVKDVSVVYVDGDVEIKLLNSLTVNADVNTSSIIDFHFIGTDTKVELLYVPAPSTFHITPEGGTAVDPSVDFTYATYDAETNTIIFTEAGSYKLTIDLTTVNKVEQDIVVSLYVCEVSDGGEEINKEDVKECSGSVVLVIPASVTSIADGALTEMERLKAIVVDTTSTYSPENYDFRFVETEEGMIYNHIPVFRLDLSSPPSLIYPVHGKYMAGREIPIVQYSNTLGVAVNIGSKQILSSRIGYNFISHIPIAGSLTISCETVSDTINVIEWDEGIRDYGIAGDATEGSVDLVVPYGVYKISDSQYYYSRKLLSVSLPQTIKLIGVFAFDGCINLNSAVIPKGTKMISDYSFRGTKLTNVDVPSSVTSIGAKAYSLTTSISSVTLSEGLMSIGDMAFLESSLTSIQIPKSVVEIGINPFSKCVSLSALTSSNTRFTIDNGYELFDVEEEKLIAFISGNSSAPTEYEIPVTIKVLGEYSVSDNTTITKVVLHPGLNNIPSRSFANCSALVTFIIPEEITSFMGTDVFASSTQLTQLTISKPLWTGAVSVLALQGSSVVDVCFVSEVEDDCKSLEGADSKVYGKLGVNASCSGSCPNVKPRPFITAKYDIIKLTDGSKVPYQGVVAYSFKNVTADATVVISTALGDTANITPENLSGTSPEGEFSYLAQLGTSGTLSSCDVTLLTAETSISFNITNGGENGFSASSTLAIMKPALIVRLADGTQLHESNTVPAKSVVTYAVKGAAATNTITIDCGNETETPDSSKPTGSGLSKTFTVNCTFGEGVPTECSVKLLKTAKGNLRFTVGDVAGNVTLNLKIGTASS